MCKVLIKHCTSGFLLYLPPNILHVPQQLTDLQLQIDKSNMIV